MNNHIFKDFYCKRLERAVFFVIFCIFISMKTLNDKNITYEDSLNSLESIKKLYHEGEEMVTILDYCGDLLSDCRLKEYPSIEIDRRNSIIFNYENFKGDFVCNHLVIKITTYGFDYDDKILSYFCINGNETSSKENVSWNEIIDIIGKWKHE